MFEIRVSRPRLERDLESALNITYSEEERAFARKLSPDFLSEENGNDPYNTLSDAVRRTFTTFSENALMRWNDSYIVLPYKYTISSMIEGLLDILTALMSSAEGEMEVEWYSEDFYTDWELSWDSSDLLKIEAQWHLILGYSEADALGRVNPSLTISKWEFMAEWKQLLVTILRAIEEIGYPEDRIPRLAEMRGLASKISKAGRLYRESPYQYEE